MDIYFQLSLDIYLGVELLSHTVTLYVKHFEELADCFPKWLLCFMFPIKAAYEGVHFLHILKYFVIIWCLYFSHPSEYEVVSHCDLDLHLFDG